MPSLLYENEKRLYEYHINAMLLALRLESGEQPAQLVQTKLRKSLLGGMINAASRAQIAVRRKGPTTSTSEHEAREEALYKYLRERDECAHFGAMVLALREIEDRHTIQCLKQSTEMPVAMAVDEAAMAAAAEKAAAGKNEDWKAATESSVGAASPAQASGTERDAGSETTASPALSPALSSALSSAADSTPAQISKGARVRVWWSVEQSYDGRVIEVSSELNGNRTIERQRIYYDDDGSKCWHTLTCGEARGGEYQCELLPWTDSEAECQGAEWESFPLQCCISLSRLVDPAKGSECTHHARCNYDALLHSLSRPNNPRKLCPVVGCAQQIRNSRCVQRVDALREALGSVPGSADTAWINGSGTLRLTPPGEERGGGIEAIDLSDDSVEPLVLGTRRSKRAMGATTARATRGGGAAAGASISAGTRHGGDEGAAEKKPRLHERLGLHEG